MAVGIVCEFNPLHNGHLYLINKVKERYDEDIIVVLGGNFLQRGNLCVIDKYNKALLALEHSVSLVVELPFGFATSSSDTFAKGALLILNELKVDKIVFGSEEGKIDYFAKAAEVELYNDKYEDLVKKYIDLGNNYPTSMNLALKELIGYEVNSPNDLLALSYVKEIIRNKYPIKPITIKRTNDYHDIELKDEITSADSIRKAIKDNIDISKYVPKNTLDYIIKKDFKEDYYKLLKYKILDSKDLGIYLDVDEGIDNKIRNVINESNTLDELIDNIKSKRYTYNKISRMLTHILCSYTKEENNDLDIRYIRVLGLDTNGRKYLNGIKKDVRVPIITSVTKDDYELLKDDLLRDEIYYLITGTESDKKCIIKED